MVLLGRYRTGECQIGEAGGRGYSHRPDYWRRELSSWGRWVGADKKVILGLGASRAVREEARNMGKFKRSGEVKGDWRRGNY